MTSNQKIKSALDFGIPCVPDVYTGEAKEYITFNYNSVPEDFGDDAPGHELHLIQVHYFCPLGHNSLARRKSIKQKLFSAGLTWPDETNASDKNGQHYVFECEDAEGVELE